MKTREEKRRSVFFAFRLLLLLFLLLLLLPLILLFLPPVFQRAAVRKASVAAAAAASVATTRRGAFPEECRRLRSLLCGQSSSRVLADTPGEVPPASVERRSSRAPHPPWSSVPVGRRTAATPPSSPSVQHCAGVQLPEPCGWSAAHASARHAAAGHVVAERLQNSGTARLVQPSTRNTVENTQRSQSHAEKTHVFEPLWWLWWLWLLWC